MSITNTVINVKQSFIINVIFSMAEFLKSYGTLIGPLLAFTLGVIAIYIKFYVDRQMEAWKSQRKLSKLIELIRGSRPPAQFYPKFSKGSLFHADQARNSTNASIFLKKINVVNSFINTIEDDVLTSCSVIEIQQFTDLKFIVTYLIRDIEKYREELLRPSVAAYEGGHHPSYDEFRRIQDAYNRLITVCDTPQEEFNYIEAVPK